MLMHECPHQGCKELIPVNQPYCDKHNRQREYDKSIRYTTDAKLHSFYLSKEWQQVRNTIHDKYYGLCVWSYYHGEIKPYEEVHHIEPIRVDWNRRLDTDNLIPLTHRAHMLVEAEYKKGNMLSMQSELYKLIKQWEQEFRR